MSERFRRIAQIWSWLPAFRAVAETEHLPSASEMMNVTPPALSRTVKQLEETLGYAVFDRKGRNIQLNERGERLLLAVRDSMRLIDDALAANTEERYAGAIRWTCNWSLTGVALDAFEQLIREHPGLLPKMMTLEPDAITEQLLRGELDIAIVNGKVDVPGLAATILGDVPHSIYCGKDHPLFGRDADLDEISSFDFAAPISMTTGTYADGWPQERDRHVVMEFSQMSVGFRACRDLNLLAVMPDDVAHDETGLWRLSPIEGRQVAFAIHRNSLSDDGPIELLLAALQERMRERRLDLQGRK